MLKILLAILEMLFGIESEPEAPPTRRPVRRPGRPRADGAGEEKPTTLEDVFKRLLGIEDEAPPAKPARRQAGAAERQAGAAEQQPARPMPRQQPAPRRVAHPAEASSMAGRAPVPMAEEAAAPAATAAAQPQFVRKLRANPAAAREAFVYAEIFGPPMADRRPGEGRP